MGQTKVEGLVGTAIGLSGSRPEIRASAVPDARPSSGIEI
jgi:hypothetical protein